LADTWKSRDRRQDAMIGGRTTPGTTSSKVRKHSRAWASSRLVASRGVGACPECGGRDASGNPGCLLANSVGDVVPQYCFEGNRHEATPSAP
jgi:hypothetical protein